MDLIYTPVNLIQDIETCIKFRKDTWNVSYGSEDNFSEEETINWFNHLKSENPNSFLHVWCNEKIIGQLEFKLTGENTSEIKMGYVYLFYLSPEYRYMGLGQKIHDYALGVLANSDCGGAMLRYIPGNTRAEKFYIKNGWSKSGSVNTKRGQLMIKHFGE
jgi:GNAT superfamily N-acetyltransferase